MEETAARLDDTVDIPDTAWTLEGFRAWALSRDFPERGRIDYLAGSIEVDMSPEELRTHVLVKTEIGVVLHRLVAHRERGSVYIGGARVSSPAARLSVEPDVVVVLWDSLDAERIREVPSPRTGEYMELEGVPDLVVEVVSDSSVGKDLRRLPTLYAVAGVPELWLVDARSRKGIRFDIRTLGAEGYRKVEPDEEGWTFSPQLGVRFRLRELEPRPGRRSYRLDHQE
ncbi:MAG TPA: Uma2 family endonuclease [Thermoanaerobaculia bacterium]